MYRQELFFGCYADPDALPEVRDLPGLLEAEMRALARPAPAGVTRTNGRGHVVSAPVR